MIGAALGASFTSTFRTVDQRAAAVGQSLKSARLGASLSQDLLKYKRSLDQLKAQQARTGDTSDAMTAKIAAAQAQFDKAARRAGKYGIEIGNAATKHRLMNQQIRESEREMRRLEAFQRNRAIRADMRGQALGMLGAAYSLGAVFKGSLEREEGAVRLGTVINSANKKRDMMLARQHARDFMRRGLTDEAEMINIQYALNSAGLEASAARIGSTVVAKVATITGGVPEQVGEVVATTFNNLGAQLEGSTEERLTRVGELLTKAQFKFQIRDFGQLGESMKYAAPVMSQYNMELAQGVTLIGQLNSAGLQGGQAGTALSASMRNMSKASEELGFELVRNKKGQFDMIATLQSLSDTIGGFDNMDQDTIDELQRLFGDEGVRGVVLLGKQLGTLKAAQEDVARSSKGLVESSYKEFLDSAPGKTKLFWNNVKLLGRAFSDSFIPVINQVLPPLTAFVIQVGEMLQANPELTKTIIGIAAGMVGLKIASMGTRFVWSLLSDGLLVGVKVFRGVGKVIGGLVSVLRFGGKAVLWLGGVFGKAALSVLRFGLALLASPITWIVGAVLALGAAAYLVYKNWEPIGNFFSNMWTRIKAVFAGGALTIVEVIGSVVKALPSWALPPGLDPESLGRAAAYWREMADTTGKLKDVEFKLPSLGEAMDDMGVGGLMKKLDGLPGLPSLPSMPGMKGAGAMLSGLLAMAPAGAGEMSPAAPVTVHLSAPITIHAPAGADNQQLADLVERSIEQAARRAVVAARTSHD